MKRQNIIVIVLQSGEIETWGNFKKMCEAKQWPYHSLKIKSFPIDFNGCKVYRCPFL